MCTLTFIPKKKGFILTNSRDELFSRPTISPKKYTIFGHNLIFPKDEKKGGTWLVLGENKVICLLNGSKRKPVLKNFYEESRGNLVLNLFQYEKTQLFFEQESFEEVPPFTMVVFDYENDLKIEEISWNGFEKNLENINSKIPKIWSSSTLYNSEQRAERKKWFEVFSQEESNLMDEKILYFHQKKHTEKSDNNILMKRDHGKETTSISQIIIKENEKSFYFKNILDQKSTTILWAEKEMDLQ